jgi:conjugative relaxase-like TrwC/TraI family protein
MLFITPAKNAKEAKDYFTRHMATSDYYLRDAAEFAGEWHGLGAELLGLEGRVDKESYFNLCENINPRTGEQLTARTKSERRVLYDFTFDAPKSVTLAYELGGDERIMDAFRGAIKDAMSEMESAMKVRVRTNGRQEDRASANMVWGEFIHRTTRPLEDGTCDPQLHCHAVTFNATWDPAEERWKAGQFADIVRDKGYYQAAFHSRFAERLGKLGYGIERDGNSFRLAGIARETEKKFSRRTGIIEAAAERLGITDAKAKGRLGARTREKKNEYQPSLRDLRMEWAERLDHGERDSISQARRGRQTTSLSAKEAMDYALSHCFERGSAIPEKRLLQTALTQGVGAANVNEVKEQLAREDVIRRERLGQRWITTKAVLKEEIDMIDFVREGRGRFRRLGGPKPARLDPELSKEQRTAATVILNSSDRVTALKGGAGTGKTRMMQATVKAIEASGKKVFTFAPSAEASRGVLRSEGFDNAETVERLLIDPKKQREVHGGVIWVDEAGLLSVKDMKRVMDVAKEQDARVVLSGDSGQHAGVYRGDALRILENDSGLKTATLSEIRRQTNENYREAVAAISHGDTLRRDGRTGIEAGFDKLDKMGAIVEVDGDGRYEQIAKDYARITSEYKGKKLKTALVISPTHAEGEKVTQAIRQELKSQGKVTGPERKILSLKSLNLTEAQRGDASEYAPGLVVQFHQNARGFKRGERITVLGENDKASVKIARADGTEDVLPLREAGKFQLYEQGDLTLAKGDKIRMTQNGFALGKKAVLGRDKKQVNNGATYEVEGFTREGDIKLSNGYVLPKNYGGLAHGYVLTSHASQGKTTDVALIALGSESFSAASREQFYVSISRGREAVRLYTDDKEAMRDAIKESGARLSATELVGEKPKPKPRPRLDGLRRAFRLHEMQRAYQAVKTRMSQWAMFQQQREREVHIER